MKQDNNELKNCMQYANIANQKEIPTDIKNALKNIRYRDAPDGYCFDDNTFYIIEHFEFDSSPKDHKKGSTAKKETAEIRRKLDQKLESSFFEHKSSMSLSDYTKNAISAFENHYNKIDSYKENFKNEIGDRQVKIIFVIENTTQMWALQNAVDTQPKIDVCNCDNFLEKFNLSKNVDYIFSVARDDKKSFHFLSRDFFKQKQYACLSVEQSTFNTISVATAQIVIEIPRQPK